MKDKFAVAAALREIAALLAIQGENQFKIRSYETAARSVEAAPDLGALVDGGRVTELDGVGEGLAPKIAELWNTGNSSYLEKVRAALPPGVLELSRVPNLGPKKIKALHEALGVSSVAELKTACEAGRVKGIKGFGAKTEQAILDGIARLDSIRHERTPLAEARALGEPLLAWMRQSPSPCGLVRAELAGSLRRWKETVGDLDLVASGDDAEAIMDHFCRYAAVARVEVRGESKRTVRLAGGVQVDLRVVPDGDFATALHHFTGSKAHHVRLRGRARERGLTISEWGLFHVEPGASTERKSDKIPVASEVELYARLDLPYIPPELREDEGEYEAAARGETWDDLVTMADVRGMVHCHTTFSDGRSTLEEMARAADALGVEYMTVTDHSPSAFYARGVEIERLKAQWDEMARVQEHVKVRLLRGTESDILEDGALDYPDAILEQMDVVIASIHSRHKMDADAMTRRLVAAMRAPVYKIWGHGLGRLIGKREPIECRVEEVLDALAGSRGAVEVNGSPQRLDLEPKWVRKARERGIAIALSVDAHSTKELGYLRYAVHTARRAGVRRHEVLNAQAVEDFVRAVNPGGRSL